MLADRGGPESEAAGREARRSRSVYVLWAVGLGLLAVLGLVCWLVVAPVLRVNAVLRDLGANGETVMIGFSGLSGWRTYWAGKAEREAAMARLGGPERAARGLRLYLLLPKRLAPRRVQAAFLLGFCNPGRQDVFMRLMADADADVRWWAVRGLFEAVQVDPELVPQAAVPLIARALADPDAIIRCQAADLLGELGPRAMPAVPALSLLLAESPPGGDNELEVVRSHAAAALGKITGRPDEHLALLIRLLGSAASGAREDAALALGKMGPAARTAVSALEKALADAEPGVRCKAALALWQIGADRGRTVPVLLGLLEKEPRDGNRRAAARALGKMGPAAKDAVGALEKALRDEHWIVREAAQEALDKIQAPAPAGPPGK